MGNMLNFLFYYILPFIVVLGILIFFHELGHFLVAKIFGVRVLKFSLGFGPKLVGRRVGETEYVISAVPLGGYVKMLGEQESDEAPLPPQDEPRSFSHQHVLRRIAIVAAGPVFNFLLAIVIFCLFYLFAGTSVLIPEVGEVRADSPADRAGFMKGDLIVEIDGRSVSTWTAVRNRVQDRTGQTLQIKVLRAEEPLTLQVVPEDTKMKNIFGEEIQAGLIGVVASGRYETLPVGPGGAVSEGLKKTWEITQLTCLTVLKLLQRVIPVKMVGGPIMIGQMTGQLAKESLTYLVPFMAVISVNLAVLNLLPIPILDGGVILFLLIELVFRKPLSIRKRELAQKVGLFLLITLMAVVFYNDVVRLFQSGPAP